MRLEEVIPMPTVEELRGARHQFQAMEPRDMYYRVCAADAESAWRGVGDVELVDGAAVLLQIWNKDFYRFRHQVPDAAHWERLAGLVQACRQRLRNWWSRTIESFDSADEPMLTETFEAFEREVGTTGASKAIHLLAARFCPMWDRQIVAKYDECLRKVAGGKTLVLGAMGTNGEQYVLFARIAAVQWRHLGGAAALGYNPLKGLDEYNYMRFSWVGPSASGTTANPATSLP